MLRLSDAFKEGIRQNIMRQHIENKIERNDTEISAEIEQIFQEASPDIEVTVRMLNINHGHNNKILSMCKPLEEYAWFVAQVRKNLAADEKSVNGGSMGIGDAIEQAINDMPKDFVIRNLITTNRAEVKDMCLTEYNETETMEMLRQEGWQEGRQEGRQEGQQESRLLDIKNLTDSTGWTAEKAMDLLKIPQNQRTVLYTGLTKNI